MVGAGRVGFGGKGGDLIVVYLLQIVLPLMGVYLAFGALGAGVFLLTKNGNNAGTIVALAAPLTLCFMVGLLWAGLYGANRLTRFHYENLVIEGKRCQYHGTVGGLVKAMWLDYIIMACTFGLYFPWYVTKLNKYTYSQVDVQGERLEFNGDPGTLLGTYILGLILLTFTCWIYYPWFANNMYEWRWNGTSISGRPFRFMKDPGGLFGQWILNAVLTMCTGGIYAPWAMCAMWDWETRHIS